MATQRLTTQWALDTNFLLHLIDGRENVRAAWEIAPALLSEMEQSLAAQFAGICLEKGIVPQAERNDALLLGEAAAKRIPFVVSSDSHLLNTDFEELTLVCHALDLPLVSVLHPTSALRSLGG
jgi:hypothetical protein